MNEKTNYADAFMLEYNVYNRYAINKKGTKL